MINPKTINIIGIIIWTILFFFLVPFKIIKKYPLIILGYFYTCFIIITNYILIGNNNSENKTSDFTNNTMDIVNVLNSKAIEVSTATFAIALATKEIFKIKVYKHLLLFMIYTLIFGVGIMSPIYFISNVSPQKLKKYNENLLRIRNISLSYSIGFMFTTYMLIITRIYQIYK
jgi:hypothetical protein